jgi:hypothetical protein
MLEIIIGILLLVIGFGVGWHAHGWHLDHLAANDPLAIYDDPPLKERTRSKATALQKDEP